MEKPGWSQIEEEAQHLFAGEGRFPLPAYSEFMPAPWVGIKPYAPLRSLAPATNAASHETSCDISEYEWVQEVHPGLSRMADHIANELSGLVKGHTHMLSKALLTGNRAWPPALAAAAKAGTLNDHPLILIMPLALSRTQDDKGNDHWTLFGASHQGPAAAFWKSFVEGDQERFAAIIGWATGRPMALESVWILGEPEEVPVFLRSRTLGQTPIDKVRTLVTFRPFEILPPAVQQAYLAGKLTLVPSPQSLVFFEHPGYRKLAAQLPHAIQIPLLHLFPRVEKGYGIRIPQSGWLDEHSAEPGKDVVSHLSRSHRWQKVERDHMPTAEGSHWDKVTQALFSTHPDHLGLYGKPMARNAQIWRENYELVLDGPHATPADLVRAATETDRKERFGYRLLFPPMRAGGRELYWHLPLVARQDPASGKASLFDLRPPLGFVTAEPLIRGGTEMTLAPRLLARPGHQEAATLFPHEPGVPRHTTPHNAAKLLEFREYLGGPLAPSLARRLLHVAKDMGLEQWLNSLPGKATDPEGATRLVAMLRECVGEEKDPGAALTFEHTRTRAFEESIWKTIAMLAEGEFRQKVNADHVAVNTGRNGGEAARVARIEAAAHRDLERLGDHLHQRYRDLIRLHGMQGKAEVVDHVFRWETDFHFSWSDSWARNQTGEMHERNILLLIPGRNRGETILMGDHYDTAYMEDVYETARGGDMLRAGACGADDNHSATTALLHAAEVLLPLAAAGKLERDVWLIHLTGEEFPSDCLGARAIARALVEKQLAFTREDGSRLDVSRTRVAGAFVLDMIGHNSARDRDVFQIAPGEGAGSARLAQRAHLANERWNRQVPEWNKSEHRRGLGRAARRENGADIPPPFAHLALAGEVRTEWEHRSALYNTDAKIFSDVGIPVVLFMENYDISRTGYHDTHDTMKNIDLDYAAALTAIAIETVTDCACAPKIQTI